ncbi:MAG: hypothetical protein WCC92_21490 [Candidatus Korobacteraceae bacterium]
MPREKGFIYSFVFLMIAVSTSWAQQSPDPTLAHPEQQQQPTSGQRMPGMQMPQGQPQMGMTVSTAFLTRQSDGTSVQPTAWDMPMVMTRSGNWLLMWMGQAFLVETQQTGPPGGRSTPAATGLDKLWSTNWGMLGAFHPLGKGSVMLRTMLSLEPATITDRRYPELFQTGETAYGVPLVDGQHPHNFVMELAAEYARPIHSVAAYIYYAPVGDPALGPPAFPHRASAAELPQATLGHHWEDSTHIAYNVATIGGEKGIVRVEASGFYGREPGEDRWGVPFGPMDSWAARISVMPSASWTFEASTGELHHPEALEPGNQERTVASAEYARGMNAASVIWGRDYKTVGRFAVNALTIEGVIGAGPKNFITGRFEWSQRDELFAADPPIQNAFLAAGYRWFDVAAYTGGYTRDLGTWHDAEIGLGANITAYSVPQLIQPYYGAHPFGVNVYLRVRLRGQH